MPAYAKPKYPRILVSEARHKKLSSEAKKLNISIAELAESKFKKAQ